MLSVQTGSQGPSTTTVPHADYTSIHRGLARFGSELSDTRFKLFPNDSIVEGLTVKTKKAAFVY